MRTLGVIGGISPASTEIYYRQINAAVAARRGEHHSARLVIHSVNFADVRALQQADAWDEADAFMADAASTLNRAGVDGALLACNTMHRCAGAIAGALDGPFIHIADATRARLDADGRRRPALLGTLTTMTERFIADRLGDDILVPDASERELIDRIIFDELTKTEVREESRRAYIDICDRLADAGADSIVLGCTEIGLLLDEKTCPLPVYDTALIHVGAAVDFLLGGED